MTARLRTKLALLSILTTSGLAHAGDKALAEELFKQGAALMQKGETAAACDKFAASNEQDRSSGTALNLARCLETLGKTASAWAEYEEAARIAGVQGRQDRITEAQARAAELKPRLSLLTINVEAPVPGLKVMRGTVEIQPAAWGTSLPTDPGIVVVTAAAPGYVEQRLEVVLEAGATRKVVTIPKLEQTPATPAAPVPAPTTAAPATKPQPSVGTPTQPPQSNPPNLTPAYLVGGAGLALVSAGAIFGVLAKTKYDSAVSACGGKISSCSTDGMARRDTADLFANVSNVGFGVGALALGVGTYLFFRAGSTETHGRTLRAVPVVASNAGGALLSGSF